MGVSVGRCSQTSSFRLRRWSSFVRRVDLEDVTSEVVESIQFATRVLWYRTCLSSLNSLSANFPHPAREIISYLTQMTAKVDRIFLRVSNHRAYVWDVQGAYSHQFDAQAVL